MKKIKVLEKEISLYSQNEEDYICITDIAKYKNSETTGLIISHWLSTRFTVEFMGFWEKIHNPDFNVTEFRNIKNQSGSNGFVLPNLENLNALFINEGISQSERLAKLNHVAIQQMRLLTDDSGVKKLEGGK